MLLGIQSVSECVKLGEIFGNFSPHYCQVFFALECECRANSRDIPGDNWYNLQWIVHNVPSIAVKNWTICYKWFSIPVQKLRARILAVNTWQKLVKHAASSDWFIGRSIEWKAQVERIANLAQCIISLFHCFMSPPLATRAGVGAGVNNLWRSSSSSSPPHVGHREVSDTNQRGKSIASSLCAWQHGDTAERPMLVTSWRKGDEEKSFVRCSSLIVHEF